MELFLNYHGGGGLRFKEFLCWRMEYTGGEPCDSFYVECPWDGELLKGLGQGMEFSAIWDGTVVCRGVVDEFELRLDGSGRRLCLSGRGMAAKLLDNEAVSREYQLATMADILQNHVYPYGIQVGAVEATPAVEGFTVANGSSEWQVLYRFARYYGDMMPRFDPSGQLILAHWEDKGIMVVGDETPVTAMNYREQRYGVLSEVVVRDRAREVDTTVKNEAFLAVGGQRRQVFTMPGHSNSDEMRLSGDFQIKESMEDWVRLELTFPSPFVAWPGELVELQRKECDFNGKYRIREVCVEASGDQMFTRLVLGKC